MNYKEAITELKQIAERIEDHETDIDELAALIARARELGRICTDKLKSIEKDVMEELGKIETGI